MSASGTQNSAPVVAPPAYQSPALGPTQQYMHEQAEAAIRSHNEKLGW